MCAWTDTGFTSLRTAQRVTYHLPSEKAGNSTQLLKMPSEKKKKKISAKNGDCRNPEGSHPVLKESSQILVKT